MAHKVIFQTATVKRSLCVLKNLFQDLTKCGKGEDKWKERLKEKVRNVPRGRRGFSGEQKKYFGKKSSFWRLLICCFTIRPWRSIRALALFPIASLSVRQQIHKSLIMCFIFNYLSWLMWQCQPQQSCSMRSCS